MQIYIDESGSFVSASTPGSWNVVVAAAAAESARSTIERSVKALKLAAGTSISTELKLNDIPEGRYISFLESLSKAHLLLFATATDAGYNAPEHVAEHRKNEVEKIREEMSRMRYEGGRQWAETLAVQLEVISPQLYAQMVCQVDLLQNVVGRSINYFAQRIPGTLTEFRWRIDQKNTSKTTYEDAFEKIAPALLEAWSVREPLPHVEGFDYRRMAAYAFHEEQLPGHLIEKHGIRAQKVYNVQELIRDNLKFEDSKRSFGIQVADLLASGLRRCLRGKFRDNDAVAKALGRLMLQNRQCEYPINLISFAKQDHQVDPVASKAMRTMQRYCRSMVKKPLSLKAGSRQ